MFREAWGTFYSGDSYIIFSSAPYGESGGTSIKSGKLPGRMEQHIHFWLGQDATQDEAAVAAFKTVELDEFLGGTPIQHREVQGQESIRFKAYFKATGIRYLAGGVKSGFSHCTPDLSPKLFQVKGRRDPIMRQTKTVSWQEMNSGDSYVLDVPEEKVLFVWHGRTSNKFEKLKAGACAQVLKTEHGDTDYEIITIRDGDENADLEHFDLFDQLRPFIITFNYLLQQPILRFIFHCQI